MLERCKLPRSGVKAFGNWTPVSAWPQTPGPSVDAKDGCSFHSRPAWQICYVGPAEAQGCLPLGCELSVTSSIAASVLEQVRQASIELDDDPKPSVADVAVNRATASGSVLEGCSLSTIPNTDGKSMCALHVATPAVL